MRLRKCSFYNSFFILRTQVDSFVTSHKLSYRDRDNEEHFWKNPTFGSKIFFGISNSTAVRHHLTPQVVFRVRLYPLTWIGSIALQWNLVFCIRKYKPQSYFESLTKNTVKRPFKCTCTTYQGTGWMRF